MRTPKCGVRYGAHAHVCVRSGGARRAPRAAGLAAGAHGMMTMMTMMGGGGKGGGVSCLCPAPGVPGWLAGGRWFHALRMCVWSRRPVGNIPQSPAESVWSSTVRARTAAVRGMPAAGGARSGDSVSAARTRAQTAALKSATVSAAAAVQPPQLHGTLPRPAPAVALPPEL